MISSTLKVILLISTLMVANAAHADIAKLVWLTGHWCGNTKGIYSEEVWLAPRAGSMVGMHRDTRDNRFSGFEFFRIVEDGTDLVYWTQPGGKPAIAFRASNVDGDTVDFINLAHDFPKRIRYQRADANTLLARIDDGTDTGPSMEWRWRQGCD